MELRSSWETGHAIRFVLQLAGAQLADSFGLVRWSRTKTRDRLPNVQTVAPVVKRYQPWDRRPPSRSRAAAISNKVLSDDSNGLNPFN